MTRSVRIVIQNDDRLAGIRSFLATVVQKGQFEAILVPGRLAVKRRIMPMLISNPARLVEADPLAPAFPVNSASQLARLTRQPAGGRLAAVLRPCEIRAFNELVKLNQGKREEVLIIGLDCPGALSNAGFRTFADRYDTLDAATRAFCRVVFSAGADHGELPFTSACRACGLPTPDGADIAVALFGSDPARGLTATSLTEAGADLLTGLNLPSADEPASAQRRSIIDLTLDRRRHYREQMFGAVMEATGSIQGLSAYLADCVNCYNCRVACPVCYCTTCVFSTDAFRHEPFQYLQWARRKGGLKMPTDTLFFHLTRMTHMSCACVGCGQCTNACPNDISLSDLFSFVAHGTQSAFDYTPGLDPSQRPPMSVFEEEEYGEVVGIS